MTTSELRSRICLCLLAVFAVLAPAPAALCVGPVERPQPLPEGDNGIAARYPGDVGIESDEGVVFAEDFEEESLEEVFKRWTSVSNKGRKVLHLSSDTPEGSAGAKSIEMTATRGHDAGGHLWKRLDQGVDTIFVRAYVKFSEDHPYVHHMLRVGAWRDSPPWPQGEAGHRHDGTQSFQTGVEPMSGYGRFNPPGAWHMYTYWCEMKSFQGPEGRVFYGNSFAPETPEQIPRGKWQCIELMIKTNSAPERHDGEQAFWVDGRLVGRWAPGIPTGRWSGDNYIIDGRGAPFEGFRWRLRDDLKINTVWLLYYMSSVFKGNPQFRAPEGVPYNAGLGRLWYDDVVVATEYIGPIKPVEGAPASGE